MDANKQTEAKNNLGLCLLRILMSFEVVLCHCWYTDTYSAAEKPFAVLKGYAVPVFMLMSFYLTGKYFVNRDKKAIQKRFWRLIWPQVGWAIIYWCGFQLIDLVFNLNLVNGIGDLIWQIFTGHSPTVNPTMWYQTDLIILTLVFTLIFYFIPVGNALVVLWVLAAMAIILQYSGLNYDVFSQLRYELRYPLGRSCEMIPYAVAGFSLAYFGIYDKLKKRRWAVICLSLVGGIVLYAADIVPDAPGYGYSGMLKICESILIMTAAVLIPFERLPGMAKIVIDRMSAYTMGVYCMHVFVATIFFGITGRFGIESGTLVFCAVVYAACCMAAYILSLIPLKIVRQLVV